MTLAWIRQANGDPGGAREAIAEAEPIAPSPSLANLFNPIPAQRARLLLAQGDIAAAARWAQEDGLRTDDEPMYQKEREHLVPGRASCWPRTSPPTRWRCWTGCRPRRPPRTGLGA